MAYIALYRKWRPSSFKDLVGQNHISRTLSNAIMTGRVGHAYLFSGPRGTGKTSTAKILAKALNCEKGPTTEPCGECESCRRINDGSSLDVFEIDAASNRGIDEIRDLRDSVKYVSADGHYKVYIIDEVHMLTAEAFNALLKTLEEPPERVVFILATTEAHKVPATIQSRCQRYDFKRITTEEIHERLKYVAEHSGLETENEALQLIALQADGGLRDALSILDQCAAIAEGKITTERVRQVLGLVGHDWIYRLTRAIYAKKTPDILEIMAELLRDGKDLRQILVELSLHFRSLMIYQATGTVANMDLYAEPDEVLEEQGNYFSSEQLMQLLGKINETLAEIKWSPQPRITVEVALLAMCRAKANNLTTAVNSAEPATNSVVDNRLAQIEAKLAKLNAMMANGKLVSAAKPAATPVTAKTPSAPKIAAPPVKTAVVTEQGLKIWQQVLQQLRDSNQEPVVACVDQAEFAGISGERLYLNFANPIFADLTKKNYANKIESILQELTGQNLHIYCGAGEAKPIVRPTKAKKTATTTKEVESSKPAVDLAKLPTAERNNLQKAFAVFGDNVVGVATDN